MNSFHALAIWWMLFAILMSQQDGDEDGNMTTGERALMTFGGLMSALFIFIAALVDVHK